MPKKRRFPPLEPSRLAFLERRIEDSLPVILSLKKLREVLLAIDGLALVAPPRDPDVDAILARGCAFDGAKARQVPGEPSQCHFNVMALWFDNPDGIQVATGYALSPDGLWRCHSWALQKNRVLETTDKRLLYYGVVLGEDQLARFLTGGSWSSLTPKAAPRLQPPGFTTGETSKVDPQR